MHITFCSGNHHGVLLLLQAALLLLNERLEDCNRLFHHLGTLHHLWQEHLALSEQLSHLVHAMHQRAFNYGYRRCKLLHSLRHILLEEFGNTLHKGILKSLLKRILPPLLFRGLNCSSRSSRLLGCNLLLLDLLRQLNEGLCSILRLIQHHRLNLSKKLRLNLIIHLQH